MEMDKQIVHYLWWIRHFLNRQWQEREYKDIINEDLESDVIREFEELLKYIKEK